MRMFHAACAASHRPALRPTRGSGLGAVAETIGVTGAGMTAGGGGGGVGRAPPRAPAFPPAAAPPAASPAPAPTPAPPAGAAATVVAAAAGWVAAGAAVGVPALAACAVPCDDTAGCVAAGGADFGGGVDETFFGPQDPTTRTASASDPEISNVSNFIR